MSTAPAETAFRSATSRPARTSVRYPVLGT
jgi:hypothetical protein